MSCPSSAQGASQLFPVTAERLRMDASWAPSSHVEQETLGAPWDPPARMSFWDIWSALLNLLPLRADPR
ncbi:hypothetical protein GBF38_005697 [Nibea albiflora]|uniref:Uncharacterized protein n=1 Tax=Nibea albiflora TaxID=240163 RepID=A0ACB7F9W8_NIBAL|nr:hypothetical protein GBF38_005697 [Nibea albiflora]